MGEARAEITIDRPVDDVWAVVGNFGGPKALRAVGKYIRDHHEVVTTFYVSNVEQYLFQDGIWPDFYQNVATLPVDDASTFVRSVSTRMGYTGPMTGPDGRATADWIAEQTWFDGRLGSYGASYMGFTQWALASTRPPHLQAMVVALSGCAVPKQPDGPDTEAQARRVILERVDAAVAAQRV